MKYEKMSPAVLSALEAHQNMDAAGLDFHVRSRSMVPGGILRQPRLIVFLRCDPKDPLDDLKKRGVVVNRPSGPLRTALVPLDAVEATSDSDGVFRIQASRALRKLDLAALGVKLPAFHARFPTPFTGKDVVIGIVDTGIDSAHTAFGSRVQRVWDQTLNGSGVTEGAYGRELTGAQRAQSLDHDGHGTHVAGIAAGADPTFQGVAPQADIVMVKTTFNDAHIADAVRYIFRVAKDAGKPCVVNLSLGGHGDSHDGLDDLSASIDLESGPDRIVCCAAGNEGSDNIHAQIVFGASQRSARLLVPTNVQKAQINAWYSGATPLEFAVRAPNGVQTPFQAVIASGTFRKVYAVPGGGSVAISTPPPDPVVGDHNLWVEIRPGAPGVSNVWRLLVRNPASSTQVTVQAWALDDQQAPTVVFTGGSAVDAMKIGSPGTAASAVTVASFTTRVSWVDASSAAHSVNMALNDISDFSSEGPLRNGAQKPDLAAPGAMIVSCRSGASNPDPAFDVSADMTINAGTSMATPVVTGLVALLLERTPGLDPNQVKALLRAQCAVPGLAAGAYHQKWGHGFIDCTNL